ncbi:telomere binding protein [Cadophora gregata]|uniref:telomere binding protein n=1 Tax=Cadophora gregata TaxID=51156 RepID=UPI0026DDCB15|nr:telomere binding protein [Cadophora gregata]KAK0126097.1 telomere binding protein [Cadophora gregata]
MEGLLTPVSTSYKDENKPNEDALVEVVKAPEPRSKSWFQTALTPAEALEILRNEPDYGTLIFVLKFIGKNSQDFDITLPSPLAAQLVHTLVSDTVPNYWPVLQESSNGKKGKAGKHWHISSDLEILLSCLRSVTALNAILLSLKQHIQKSKELKKSIGGPKIRDILAINLQLLEAILGGVKTVSVIWKTICATPDQPKQKGVWNEFLGLAAGGKILGTAAESEDVINDLSEKIGEKHWVAHGTLYSRWLSQNITYWAKNLPIDSEDAWQSCAELLSKSFRLGHTDSIMKELLSSLLLQEKEYKPQFLKLVGCLPNFEQRNFLYSLLKIVSRDFLSSPVTTEADPQWWKSDASVVAAAARLISLVVAENESRKNLLISWLTNSSGAGVGDGIAIRRAVIMSLSVGKSDIEAILEKSLAQFGDQLYIRHTPTLQQEVHAQVLLLAAGYVHRKAPLRLTMMMRSGSHLGVVSNRLAASSPRARFLGMCVGEALSGLVDKGDKKMDFKVDEMSTDEANWYKSLVNIFDSVGSLDPFKTGAVAKVFKRQPQRFTQQVKRVPVPTGSKIIAIEEIDDSEEEGSDDDDLTPYAKPDSDAEDSDEDATLITRNKPTAPVYIRDLITYLRDTENYDRQKLALTTAAPLIRRKANFGTEVSAHAEELAALLVGLQDKYEIDNFQDMRIQGMIAVLIALPLKMGQWFSKTFFDGDYSISQRASVLTTLGLGARELGGFGSEDESLTKMKNLPSTANPSFPSKTLPPHIHTHYTPRTAEPKKSLKSTPISALDTLTTNLSNTMIAPIATSLADKLTGPSILKIRTFSSRMAVEASRKKPTTNALAQIVSTGFFFPLTGRFSLHLKTFGASSTANITFHPYLLSLFLKTLSLLLHASGPNTLSLPQMTSEFWDLCLGLRAQAVGDVMVLEALLFSFLSILEVNGDKRGLVEGFGRQMLETQEWVEGVFGRLGAGGSEEDERARMLAAGVLVRIRENVEKYQALLLGDMASFRG